MATSAGEQQRFVGVDYGLSGTNLPHHHEVVSLLKNQRVKNVKIYDADQNILRAFKDSGIKLSVAVPDSAVPRMAKNENNFADKWVKDHIVDFHNIITSIGVGNEWLHVDHNRSPQEKAMLVQAMDNLHKSLQKHQNNDLKNIKVSTPHAYDFSGFPPSKGIFEKDNAAVLKALLHFLKRTNSFFMLNCYPFFAYADSGETIDKKYALFTKGGQPEFEDVGLKYYNLFDAMLDTAISAMEKAGFPDMPIVITETGWPNGGDRLGAEVENARVYNQNVIKHVLWKTDRKGTPKRPNHSFPTYIFALFNENNKPGNSVEKHWGHFNPNKSPIYPLRMEG